MKNALEFLKNEKEFKTPKAAVKFKQSPKTKDYYF